MESKHEVSAYYVCYKKAKSELTGSLMLLEKIEFDGWVTNSFQTEQEAIDALIKDQYTYIDIVILKELNIRKS